MRYEHRPFRLVLAFDSKSVSLLSLIDTNGNPTDLGSYTSQIPAMLFGNRVIDISCRKAQAEVEKAFLKWGRYRLPLDKYTGDLVIGVRKGTGKAANPTINGGPVDKRPRTIET